MEKDTFKTAVIFLLDLQTDENKEPDSVFAFFPEIPESKDNFMSYAHIGQHSGCKLQYAEACLKATPEQYKDLAAELESIGYDLEILTKL